MTMVRLRRLLLILLVVVVALTYTLSAADIDGKENDDAKGKNTKGSKDAKDAKGSKDKKDTKGTGDTEDANATKEEVKPLKYLVTEEVFFDIKVFEKKPYVERLQIACFGEIVPITCLNFVALAKGYQRGRDMLHYKSTPVHRIVRDFILQMGDVTGKKGKSGSSIYGPTFDDENFRLSHRGIGWVSMANSGRNTNNSQFFITLQSARWLDGKHVVFGKVLKGMDAIRKLAQLDTQVSGRPKTQVEIVDSGVLDIPRKYELSEADALSDKDIRS